MQQSCGLIRRVTALAVFVAAFAPESIRAAQPAAKSAPLSHAALKKSVERLIAALDSKTRGDRVRAERDLLALGPGILPLLPPPELTANVSVREAVRRVRIRLENTAARDSVKPSRVTLKGTRSLNEILREVSRQTGNRFDVARLSKESLSATINVSYAGATFWAVIDDLTRRGRLRFRVVSSANRIAVTARPAGVSSRPIAVDNRGAFRVAVLSLRQRPIVGDDANRLLRVRWSITAEPRLRPLFLKYAGRSLVAEMPAGKALAPFDRDASLEVTAVDGAAPISQSCDFILPKGTAVASIRLRGQVKMLTAARGEPVEFRDLTRAKGSSKRRGGVTVTVNGVSSTPAKAKAAGSERIAVDVSISYDVGGPAFESHRTWIFYNRVYLETAAGTRIPADPSFKTIVQRDGAVGVAYHFTVSKIPLAKLNFVYVAPTLLIDVPVKFDFAALPFIPRKQAGSSP
jgi:hypothetical protein